MGFLEKLFSKQRKGSLEQESKNVLWLYIRCNKCGKELRLFVDKNTDLENQYKEAGAIGPDYVLKKEAMDDKCLTKMFIRIEFDNNRSILSREIINGEFITRNNFLDNFNIRSII